jgi:hypothetical protein
MVVKDRGGPEVNREAETSIDVYKRGDCGGASWDIWPSEGPWIDIQRDLGQRLYAIPEMQYPKDFNNEKEMQEVEEKYEKAIADFYQAQKTGFYSYFAQLM